MKKIVYLFSLLMLLTSRLVAHETHNNQQDTLPTKDSKVKNAIERFKTSDFMMRFNECKTQMETDARSFISHQNAYNPKDIRAVQMAYDKTAIRFNAALSKIKLDFKNPEIVKMMNKAPDMYANSLKKEMDDLENLYKAQFNLKYEDVTGSASAFIGATAIEVVKMVSELVQHFKSLKFEKEFMNDQYIQQNLVDPYTLPTWAQLVEKTPIKTDGKVYDPNNNKTDGKSPTDNQEKSDEPKDKATFGVEGSSTIPQNSKKQSVKKTSN